MKTGKIKRPKRKIQKVRESQIGIAVMCLLLAAGIIGGCSRQENTAVSPGTDIKTGDSVQDSILCDVSGDSLVVTHRDAWYQCCLESKILVHRSGTTLDIVEYDTGEPCDCMCTFDLTTTIVDLEPGDYTVQVWSETGRFFGKCSVSISSSPHLSGSTQSDCQAYSKTTTVSAQKDSIVAVCEDRILTMYHFNAYYNCCFDITIDCHLDGTVLDFIEHPSGNPCYCMCYFNLSASVAGLAPGLYTVRVWNEDQSQLFGQTEGVVPSGNVFKSGTPSETPPGPGGGWWYDSRQDGCKTYAKKYQTMMKHSDRMHHDVYGHEETERGSSEDALMYADEHYSESHLTQAGGN